MAFTFSDYKDIPDVKIIWPKIIKDERGWFAEMYNKQEFNNNGLHVNVVQENHSRSNAGVFRGLHYQTWPYEQGKLIRVIKGRLIDYFLDLRKSSKSFGKLGSYLLTPSGPMLWIPRGFAHGIYIIEDDTELIYKVDNLYAPLHERGISARSVIGDLPSSVILNTRDEQWPIFSPYSEDYFP